jgi:hypothetical protein
MLSKAVCVAIFVAIPGFVGYPAPLNVDRRAKSSPAADSVDVEIWPAAPTTVVSLQPRWLIVDSPPANLRFEDDYVLTKELQRQLRRVGCYGGDINGTWTASTQRAMQTFNNRVNATLPLERPDPTLLALLQGHPDKTCSKPCPSGENPISDGHCVPGAVASPLLKTGALTQPKAQTRITSWSATETASLEDDIPKLPPTRPSGPPVIAAPTKPPQAPKFVAPPPKPVPQRPPVATAQREHARSSSRSDQPRVSQRSEREPSRSTHPSEFARSLFQRIDNSLR